MALTQTASSIVQEPRQFLHLIYGEPGVGKTSWCAQISGHYFISTEPGTKGVSVFGHNCLTWPDFMTTCIELKKARETNFEGQRVIEAVIIDSYDALWQMCGNHIMASETFIVKGRAEKFKRVEDVEYGKAYARVNSEVIGIVRKLGLLGFGVILIGHMKERLVKFRGQELTGVGLSSSQSVQDAIVKECDAVGYFMSEETIKKNDKGEVESVELGRWQYWQPSFLRLAKHRLEGFPERLALPIGQGWQVYEDTFREIAQKKAGA